jgi:DNA polymerase IV
VTDNDVTDDDVTEGVALTRSILHIDMDAFFVSVELLDHPELVDRPVVVGGSSRRGVIAAANYEARRHGVHSAMSSVRAAALCPDLVFLPGRFHLYTAASRRIMDIFRTVTPLVEPISLDEAFLDVTGSRRLVGDPVDIAHQLRAAVHEAEGLHCSVGVASTKFVAKLASRAAKPRVQPTSAGGGADGGRVVSGGSGGAGSGSTDTRARGGQGTGVLAVGDAEVLAFLHPLEVGELWGVGPATLSRLHRHGVATVGDLARLPVEVLESMLGLAAGRHLHDLAAGIDPRPVVPGRREKSVGHEQTYTRDLSGRPAIDRELLRLCDAVAARLATKGIAGTTITVKVRFTDFRTVTRSRTVATPLSATGALVAEARDLAGQVDLGAGVRLLGVSVSSLAPADAGRQLSFEDLGRRGTDDEVQRAVDAIRDRWGQGAIGPAALLDEGRLQLRRPGDDQWGPGTPAPLDPPVLPEGGSG